MPEACDSNPLRVYRYLAQCNPVGDRLGMRNAQTIRPSVRAKAWLLPKPLATRRRLLRSTTEDLVCFQPADTAGWNDPMRDFTALLPQHHLKESRGEPYE